MDTFLPAIDSWFRIPGAAHDTERKPMHSNIALAVSVALLIAGCTGVSSKDIARAKVQGIPLIIYQLRSSSPDTDGAVDGQVRFVNTSERSIKEVVFTVLPFDSAGELARPEMGRPTARLRATGPYEPGQGNGVGRWQSVWQNNSIVCMELAEVEITYVNDETARFDEAALSRMFVAGIWNDCEVQ